MPGQGSGSVVLHTEPSESAPLLSDVGMHGPNPSTMDVSDIGSRVATGQKYAVADIRGDWTAIWYLGQKGWFRNPADAPAAYPADGFVATPKEGKATVPVYGSAYPEAGAYPKDIPVQELKTLPYQLGAGQKYSVGGLTGSSTTRRPSTSRPTRSSRARRSTWKSSSDTAWRTSAATTSTSNRRPDRGSLNARAGSADPGIHASRATFTPALASVLRRVLAQPLRPRTSRKSARQDVM